MTKKDSYNPFTYALAAFVLTPLAAVGLVCLFVVLALLGVLAVSLAILLLVVWVAVPFVVYAECKREIAKAGEVPVAEVEDATRTALHGLVADLRTAAQALRTAVDTKVAPIVPPPAAASPAPVSVDSGGSVAPANVTGQPAAPADGSKVNG